MIIFDKSKKIAVIVILMSGLLISGCGISTNITSETMGSEESVIQTTASVKEEVQTVDSTESVAQSQVNKRAMELEQFSLDFARRQRTASRSATKNNKDVSDSENSGSYTTNEATESVATESNAVESSTDTSNGDESVTSSQNDISDYEDDFDEDDSSESSGTSSYMDTKHICGGCNGKGMVSCRTCHGSGKCSAGCNNGIYNRGGEDKECSVCYGSGECQVCGGEREIECSVCLGKGYTY